MGQILLPMVAGIVATKADLTEWVYEQGLTALHELLSDDTEEIAGSEGKHEKKRTHNHWGWISLRVVTAEKKFRRIKGYRQMSILVRALRREHKSLDRATKVA